MHSMDRSKLGTASFDECINAHLHITPWLAIALPTHIADSIDRIDRGIHRSHAFSDRRAQRIGLEMRRTMMRSTSLEEATQPKIRTQKLRLAYRYSSALRTF